MTDLVVIAICGVLLSIVTASIVIAIVQRVNKRLSNAYIALGGCVFGWLCTVIVYRLVVDAEIAVYLDNLPFPFIAFLPVALFSMTLLFYHKGKYATGKLIILLSIIPFCTSLVALIPQLSFLLRTGHVVTLVSPLHVSDYVWNWWFYVHTAYSYALTLASSVVVITQHHKQPSGYALPSGLIVASILITIMGNVLVLLNLFEIDFTMITSSFSVITLYIAIANNPSVEYLVIARKELYHYLDEYVFIMDKQNQVIDVNKSARKWLDEIGFSEEGLCDFEQIIACVVDRGGVIKEALVPSASRNIFMKMEDEMVVYALSEHVIVDKKGRLMGSYASLTDITQYNKMITQLEQTVEIDPLTGIANRRAYEQQLTDMDKPENFPLSVIMGDVNRLKQVNDNLGHQQGDELLCVVADVLRCVCPERGLAARIGGDEFALLIPRCGGEEAESLVKEIRHLLAEMKGPLAPSIALGVATKTRQEENLQILIDDADRNMYRQKKYDRRSR